MALASRTTASSPTFNTTSTIALDGDTGTLKFYLQHTPHDAWDYDGVNEVVLADLKIGGKLTPAMMKADRNGFFYVANREDGNLISAEKFIYVNWAEKIDLATTRPVEVVSMRPTMNRRLGCAFAPIPTACRFRRIIPASAAFTLNTQI